MKLPQALTIKTSARNNKYATLYIGINSIPVDVVTIVFLHSATKEYFHCSLIVLIGDDEHIVTLLKLGGCHRNDNLIGTPQT